MEKSLSIRLHELLKSEFTHSSRNLKKFASKRNYMKNHNRVLQGSDGVIYIGINDYGWLTGARLNAIAIGDFQTWAFCDETVRNCKDITEWFINEYSKKGMCAYTDMRHDFGDAFSSSDNYKRMPDGVKRVCSHCGKTETLKSKMLRKVWWE